MEKAGLPPGLRKGPYEKHKVSPGLCVQLGWVKETSDEVVSTRDRQLRLEAVVRACVRAVRWCAATDTTKKWLTHVTHGLGRIVPLVYQQTPYGRDSSIS